MTSTSRFLVVFAIVGVFVSMAAKAPAQPLQAAVSPARTVSAASLPAGPSPENPDGLLPLVSAASPHLLPGAFPLPAAKPGLPKVFAPSRPREIHTRYPWKRDIVTTVFWIGELPTPGNPVPNTVSAWDRRWTSNYGGYDDPDPDAREGYLPRDFTPGQNPFYFALPYNDISRTGTKASARAVIPWFEEEFYRDGRTVLKGRWIAIRQGDRVCYAQWEDVGPFETDDWEYVFGDQRPKTTKNRCAGLDVSPAVRDYLNFGTGFGLVDWRFVDIDEVPDGPWKQYGANNPFANSSLDDGGAGFASETLLRVREIRDRLMVSLQDGPTPRNPADPAPVEGGGE